MSAFNHIVVCQTNYISEVIKACLDCGMGYAELTSPMVVKEPSASMDSNDLGPADGNAKIAFHPPCQSGTLGENKPVLNGQEVEYAIELKSHRFDFGAYLVDGHPLCLIPWTKAPPFPKFDYGQASVWL
jgi:hypothetical protein